MSDVEVGEGLEGLNTRLSSELVDEQTGQEIIGYLLEQMDSVDEGRASLVEKWNTWRRHRRIEPEFARKNDPWPNSSNLVPPVTASNTNGVYSYLRRAFLQRRPLWQVNGADKNDPRAIARAKAWERFINRLFESSTHMNGRKHLKTSIYEDVSMGTQFVEFPWMQVVKSAKRQDGETGTLSDVVTLQYEGPGMVPIRLEDFYAPLDVEDIQETPWVAIRKPRVPEHVIKANGARGFFINVERLVGAEAKEYEENEAAALDRQGISTEPSPGTRRMYDLCKAWVYWDIDGDGFEEDVIVWFERESGIVLRWELNDIFVRQIMHMVYFPEPFSLYGVGVGKMAEHVQEEITTLHNMRVDGLRLHNQQIVKVRRGSGLKPRERLHPMRVIELDDPERDMRVEGFPDISGGTLEAEQVARGYLNMFTGVSEAMLGMPDTTAKSGTSPSLQMFLAQQGNAVLETAVENIADALSFAGQLVTIQLIRNADAITPSMMQLVPVEDQPYIEEVLRLPLEELPNVLSFSVSVTDVAKTEDAKRQNLLALNQLYTMYYQEGMQLQGLVADPQAPPEMKQFALKVFVGKTKIIEETMALLGQEHTGDLVPYVENVRFLVAMVEQQQKMQMEAMREQFERGGGAGGGSSVPAGGAGAFGGSGQGQGMGPAGAGAMGAGGVQPGLEAPAGFVG